ncbi:MAG TPA: helix-turn-helix domain-containing protein [Noviherbaspirillum sp.]
MKQTSLRNKPIPVYFLLRERTLALDLIGPAEVLRYANQIAEKENGPPLFALHYISAESRIDTSIGLDVTGFSCLPDQLPPGTILFLVGCAGSDDDFGSRAVREAVAWLRRHVTPLHRLVCICSGAQLAGHAGLLDGRLCTTHHNHFESLRKIAPRAQVLENRIFVEDGHIYTSAGVTAGIDLTLHLVAQIAGHQFAAMIARAMVIYLRRTGTDPQLSPWLAFRNHIHPAIHRVQDAVISDPSRDWNTAQLAQIACISGRHLTRLFREHTGTGIVDYLQRIRIALARELLMQSQFDMERIAEKAGFNSGRQLRRVWKKFETAPPSRYRVDEWAGNG